MPSLVCCSGSEVSILWFSQSMRPWHNLHNLVQPFISTHSWIFLHDSCHSCPCLLPVPPVNLQSLWVRRYETATRLQPSPLLQENCLWPHPRRPICRCGAVISALCIHSYSIRCLWIVWIRKLWHRRQLRLDFAIWTVSIMLANVGQC